VKINLDSLNKYKEEIRKVEFNIHEAALILQKYKEYFSSVTILYGDCYNDNTYDAVWSGLEFRIRDTFLSLELDVNDLYLDVSSFEEINLHDGNTPYHHHDLPTFPIKQFNDDLFHLENLLSSHPHQVSLDNIYISFD